MYQNTQPGAQIDAMLVIEQLRAQLSQVQYDLARRMMLSSFSTTVSSPAAAALNCTEDVLQQILLATDKAADIIEAFRLDTVFNAAPFFQQALVNGPTTS